MNVCLDTNDTRSASQHHQSAPESPLTFYDLAAAKAGHRQSGGQDTQGLRPCGPVVRDLAPPLSGGNPASQRISNAGRQQVGKVLKKLPAGPENGIPDHSSHAALRILRRNGSVRETRKRSENVASIDRHRARGTRQEAVDGSISNVTVQVPEGDRNRSLARVVHDLRTPLMASSGYCDLLLGGVMGELRGEQADLVERIRRSLGRLARLTETMLEFGAGRKDATSDEQPRNAPIRACVEQALNETLPLTHKKNQIVNVKLAETGAALPVDSEPIERVLINLIENSCKFTPRGGKIQIRVSRVRWHSEHGQAQPTPWGLRVDVVDTGAGIPDKNLDHVFDEFVSTGGAENRSGRGLGLAICKTIVTAQGGRIWAARHRGGAKISFILPTGKSTFNPNPLAQALQTA